MQAPNHFRDFLKGIRLTSKQVDDARRGHQTLRGRLVADGDLSSVVVATFLQGSYRRATAVRPKGDTRADVDIIVVTNIDADGTDAGVAMETFIPFVEKHYPGKYRRAGRSIQIELSYVDLDLVVTAAPSEVEEGFLQAIAEVDPFGQDEALVLEATYEGMRKYATEKPQWQTEPLLIPDREAQIWEPTHPLAQIWWTAEKNARCNGHYVNVVKAVKWWRLEKCSDCKYPKGYPVEHMVGDCCPDGATSVAEGFTVALESMCARYGAYASAGQVPYLPDHGVPEHNVLARTSPDEFSAFYEDVYGATQIAREALDDEDLASSANRWRDLFGSKFPAPSAGDDGTGKGSPGAFTPREDPSEPRGARWA